MPGAESCACFAACEGIERRKVAIGSMREGLGACDGMTSAEVRVAVAARPAMSGSFILMWR